MRNRLAQLLLFGAALCVVVAFAGAPTPCAAGERPAPSKGRADLKAAAAGTATGQQAAADAPLAVFKELEYNAGKVRQGTPIEHTFVVKNEGKGTLNILSAKPG
jgi:hypothetical protein